jgi:hypothetical protein
MASGGIMDILFYMLVLSAGYVLGLGSRFVVKETLANYVDMRMKELNEITTTYTNKVQITCDKMIEDAQEKAINIYKEALAEASEVIFSEQPKNLN